MLADARARLALPEAPAMPVIWVGSAAAGGNIRTHRKATTRKGKAEKWLSPTKQTKGKQN